MTEPTTAQLVHLVDHAGRRQLTPAEHARLYDGVTALAARVAEYEAALGWETTCLGCSRTTTAAYGETVRAEQAEAAVQRVRELHRRAHLYECDCPCPVPADEDDDAFDEYWERHSTDDDGDIACLDRPVEDICPTCLTRDGDPQPWPCPTALAFDTPPEPADTDPARPITQHWTQEAPRA